MGYSKADFKARREMLGISQSDVALAADVNISTVKRWEKPGCPDVPDDVWAWLENYERIQAEVVASAVSHAVSDEVASVQVTYYRSQEQYDELGRDPGPFGVANANARLVALRLMDLRREVDFCYPDEAENVYHDPEGNFEDRYKYGEFNAEL